MDTLKQEEDWYWELIADCPTDMVDLISTFLFEVGALGVEEELIEDRTTRCKVFFPSSVLNPEQLLASVTLFPDWEKQGFTIVRQNKKPVQNWQDGWRDHFRSIEIGEHFRIRPPWETPDVNKKEIVIYPGQGFGTGYHESTHLALTLMEWLLSDHAGLSVSDIGTGSGILAIAALLMQSISVTAIDLDGEALLEVPENMRLSGVSPDKAVLVQCGPEALKSPTDLVVANIEGHILITLADALKRLTKPNGFLLLSGILTETEPDLMPVFQEGFEVLEIMRMNEWTGMVLKNIQV